MFSMRGYIFKTGINFDHFPDATKDVLLMATVFFTGYFCHKRNTRRMTAHEFLLYCALYKNCRFLNSRNNEHI